MRWNHPEHGSVFPDDFIKLAEDNGTILPIDAAVLEQACRQAQTWQEFGVTLQVGVNLSARQFQDPAWPTRSPRSCEHRLDPRSSASRSPRAWPWTTST